MSVSYAPTKLRVPLGFEHLLEALAREVLREQPKDIINFAAEYFRRKLVLRDEGTLDGIEKSTTTKSEDIQPKQAQPSVKQDVVNTEQPEVVTDIDLSDPEVHKAASTIQAQFRSYRKREEAKRNQKEAQSKTEDDQETSDHPSNVLSDLDLDDPELNKAASVIQSKFKTYLSEKNKTTEQAETQEENEGVGGDTELSTLHTEDPDLTKVESTTDKITPETEESNTDEQVLPPAELQEEPERKEESVPEPSSSDNQEKVEQEGGPEEVPSQPVPDEEQPAETEGEGASKGTEPQVEGGESEVLPEKVEETKEEDSGGGDSNDGNGEVETAEGTATENVEQQDEAASDGEKQEAPEGDGASKDPEENIPDDTS